MTAWPQAEGGVCPTARTFLGVEAGDTVRVVQRRLAVELLSRVSSYGVQAGTSTDAAFLSMMA